MRVLYLTDSLSDLDGVGRYTVRLLRALEERRPGLEVHVLLARKHRPTSADVPSHWKVDVALPPDYFFYMSPLKFRASAMLGTWRTARAAKSCDLVHAIKDYPHNYVALLGARRAGVPCIATGHGTYTVQPLLAPRHAEKARWCYENFAAMIAVSRYTAQRVAEILGPSHPAVSKMRVIPNAVNAEVYAQRAALPDRPWSARRFTLSIGELKERKGHHLALAAWCRVAAAIPELHHFIVGKRSDDAYQRSLVELVETSGFRERVHFLGNVDESEKIDLLQRCELFLHVPVTAQDGGFEGFGIVYLEAAASGAPCVGTLGCGAADAIVDGVTGFLVEPEVDAVSRALSMILGDANLKTRLGAAGRAHAVHSSWSENAATVLSMYDEVLR